MTQKTIDRINELARKSKTVGLTVEEKEEQQKLRREYIDAYKQSLHAQLDNTVVVRPDGTREKLSDMKKKK
ncbi:MAG: DUF896 domain-containing protein [Clostridia bacterium]|nr:DUF896 domain-containing protein [Clostridia bacterium]